MAKRKANSKGYKSKEERPNVRKDIRKVGRREYVGSIDQIVNKLHAFKSGKRVMMTIPNPDKNNTKERFIRVPMTLGAKKDA
tara:strand:+ start:24009 stop:24254 length:246 start_codon:yes stop_codon:yes gene_type:complete